MAIKERLEELSQAVEQFYRAGDDLVGLITFNRLVSIVTDIADRPDEGTGATQPPSRPTVDLGAAGDTRPTDERTRDNIAVEKQERGRTIGEEVAEKMVQKCNHNDQNCIIFGGEHFVLTFPAGELLAERKRRVIQHLAAAINTAVESALAQRNLELSDLYDERINTAVEQAVAKEREECAKVAYEWYDEKVNCPIGASYLIAGAIRSRPAAGAGEKGEEGET